MTSIDALHPLPEQTVATRGWLARALHRVQVARMKSVLSQMDDKLLARIGISRDEIPDHAEWLLRRE